VAIVLCNVRRVADDEIESGIGYISKPVALIKLNVINVVFIGVELGDA